MTGGFDDDFIKAATLTEPSHEERSRPLSRRAERRRRKQMVAEWRVPEYRRKVWGQRAAQITALGVVAAVGVGVWSQRGPFGLLGSGSQSTASTPLLDQAAPSASARAISASDPFAGSPAASYATGPAGLTPPAAGPMGGYSARQVSAAYAATRRMLAAAGLDRQTLLGGRPEAMAKAVDAHTRSYFLKNLDKKNGTRGWVVSLYPGSAELATGAIKVHGTMAAAPATWNRARGLNVKVDYLFVYAIQAPHRPATLERLVVRLSGTAFWSPGDYGPRSWGSSAAPARCTDDSWVHPDFGTEGSGHPGGPTIDPYDQSRADPKGVCRTVSRT